jgi:hypothetical protein
MRAADDYGYLEMNCFSNAFDHFEHASKALGGLDDPFRWKWATIALSSGLYHLMICALEGLDPEGVIDFRRMNKDDAVALKSAQEQGNALAVEAIRDRMRTKHPSKLIGFKDALKEIKKPGTTDCVLGEAQITISSQCESNILKLRDELRNEFEHFIPITHAIEQRVFIQPMKDTLHVATQLLDARSICLNYADGRDRFGALLTQIGLLLDMNEKWPLSKMDAMQDSE